MSRQKPDAKALLASPSESSSTSSVPVWLLDIDGVLRARGDRASRTAWPRQYWRAERASRSGPLPPEFSVDLLLVSATPVLDFIRAVHDARLAEIVWHTSWQHFAKHIFAKCFDLPNFDVADSPEFEQHRANIEPDLGVYEPTWWKIGAAERVLASGRRLLWTDDELAFRATRPSNRSLEALAAHEDALLLSPHEDTGLSPAALETIAAFLAR